MYESYKTIAYNPTKIADDVKRLYADPYVKNRKGIFEYILGGETDTRLLDVRIFDDATKRKAYALQTNDANQKSISNCPLCANGNNANKTKIYLLKEMDADHVQAWSKGGATTLDNCEMLCITHNRSKGNR